MNGFEGKCFGLRWRGKGCDRKTLSKVGACLVVVSVAVVFIYRDKAFNPFARFTKTSTAPKVNTIRRGNEVESCLSRGQSHLYRKSSPHKPSSYLIDKLRRYEELHKRCGPDTDSYKRSIEQVKSGKVDNSTDCKYVVWVAMDGLGNRILSITSFFLYALLTNRVLLINQEHSMANLFCEPFPNTSWILPENFPVTNKFDRITQDYDKSYGNMLKSNTASYLFFYLRGNYDHHYEPFFCDQDQPVFSEVPWLIMKSDLYFIPPMFLMSIFEQELSKLFPDIETVFHHLGRYLFHPSNQVWSLITKYYQEYFAKAEKKIGIQIRIFNVRTSPFEYVMDQLLACAKQENLLPEVDTRKSIASASKNQTNKAVLITSLFPGFSEKLRRIYGDHPTKTGEVVEVYQPSHEGRQQSYSNSHNIEAWAEIYLLSLSDELVTSGRSTFGYVAQGLRGITPMILYEINQKKPDPPCGRGISMEPCYHSYPYYDCKAKTGTSTFFPHVRRCEDVSWGYRLFGSRR